MRRAGCTIISPNYLPFARTLAASYTAQHPGQPFYVLIVADVDDMTPFQGFEGFIPIALGDIGVPNLRAAAMRYDILELNTNVKPTFLKYLLSRHSLDAVVYLDPDIFVYQPLDPVFSSLEQGATAVLTPHMLAPVFDGRSPSEQDLLYNGTYNLGFLGIARSTEGSRLLDWWEARCLDLGFSEGRTGLFVDQKWMNLAPGLFAGVQIARDRGLNMAYWNLHERRLTGGDDRDLQVEGMAADASGTASGAPPAKAAGLSVHAMPAERVPLRFFHFSGLDPADTEVLSRNTDRFTLADRPELRPLFAAYRAALQSNSGHAAEKLAYGFDVFTDGTAVTRLARRIYAAHESRFGSQQTGEPVDPFSAQSSFARFAREQGLVKGQVRPAKTTWQQFHGEDRRVRAVHRMLRVALRVLGPHRYELLMRYLGFISVLRHQGSFLRDPRWAADEQSSRSVR